MISYKNKCIFVHIPKTGGTSIESLIWKKSEKCEKNLWMGFVDEFHNKYQTGGLQHLLATQIKEEVESEIFNTFFKFTIVRNPYEKAVSQFEYLKKRKDLRDFLGFKIEDDMNRYLELIQLKKHVQWEPQSNFIYDEKDNCLVDFIGRFENFNTDVEIIINRLGLGKKFFGLMNNKIPHLNKSNRKGCKSYFDLESKKTIELIYKRDLDLLNYDF
jgi:hypothetical protein